MGYKNGIKYTILECRIFQLIKHLENTLFPYNSWNKVDKTGMFTSKRECLLVFTYHNNNSVARYISNGTDDRVL
jgi:hypothetical protein